MKTTNKTIAVFSALAIAFSFAIISGCSDGPATTDIDRSKNQKVEVEEDKPIPSKNVGIME